MNKPINNWSTGARPVRRHAMLTAEEESRLIRDWQQRGDRAARDRLVAAFAPLATTMVRRMSPGTGPADQDLMQQASIGLMKAADRFDPERGHRFATYAVWWVRAEIQEFKTVSESVVRRPNSGETRKLVAQLQRLDAALAADPDADRAEADLRAAQALGVGVDRVAGLRARINRVDTSLNVPALEEGGEERQALIVDPLSVDDPGAMQPLDTDVLRKALVEALADLPERDRDIIVATQIADPPATLESLGVRFGISKERVRQLRERAFETLRKSLRRRNMTPEAFV